MRKQRSSRPRNESRLSDDSLRSLALPARTRSAAAARNGCNRPLLGIRDGAEGMDHCWNRWFSFVSRGRSAPWSVDVRDQLGVFGVRCRFASMPGLHGVAVIRLRQLAPRERGHHRFPLPFVRVNGAVSKPRPESIPIRVDCQVFFFRDSQFSFIPKKLRAILRSDFRCDSGSRIRIRSQ